jgi:hypothetical protein
MVLYVATASLAENIEKKISSLIMNPEPTVGRFVKLPVNSRKQV